MAEPLFQVGVQDVGDPVNPRRFYVQLPHSCDEWTIARAADKDEAIGELVAFIEGANQALRRLKALS